MATHYIAATDIVDDLIKPEMITESDLDETDDFITQICRDNDVDPVNLPNPIPYKVKALAISYCCCQVCIRKTGTGPKQYQDAGGTDNFGRKLKIFQDQVDRRIGQMDYLVILGLQQMYGGNSGPISIERG